MASCDPFLAARRHLLLGADHPVLAVPEITEMSILREVSVIVVCEGLRRRRDERGVGLNRNDVAILAVQHGDGLQLREAGLLGIVELVAAEIVLAHAESGAPPRHHTPEVSLHGPARTDTSPPTSTSPMQNLFHAVNYTIKCDRSVKFENGQDIDATYCTATTETPPAVSRFAAASPSGIVLQEERNMRNKIPSTIKRCLVALKTPVHIYYLLVSVRDSNPLGFNGCVLSSFLNERKSPNSSPSIISFAHLQPFKADISIQKAA